MLHILQTALELGFLYALVPMALFLSFRILDIADMTTDGCFVLGTAVSVTMAAAGHPFLAVPAAMLAGICAGFVTAFQQTSRRSVHSRRYHHQYGTLHHQSDGNGLECQRESFKDRDHLFPASENRYRG